MKTYQTIEKLINDIDALNWSGVLFTNRNTWNSAPRNANFFYLDEDDELDDIVDEETMLPRLVQENFAERFLDVQVFTDVIDQQRELNPNSTLNEFIHALNYYREYDTFYWK